MVLRLILTASLASLAAPASAQDALDQVRQLYVSADYDATLAELDRLPPATAAEEQLERDRYRAMVLIALGRTTEAHAAIERILLADPRYELSDEEAAPRIRTAFNDVRQRVLPGMARSLYSEGKAAYDRKAVEEARPALERALTVIDLLPPEEPGMADLRTLVAGFLQLSRAATPAPPPPVPEKVETAPAGPAAAIASGAPPPSAPAAPSGPGPAPSSAPAPSDTAAAPPGRPMFTEPVALQQVMPPWSPGQFTTLSQTEFRGVIEVDINEQGDVTAARIIDGVHPAYDAQLLEAAKGWKYQPARRDGQPVRASKRVSVILRGF